MTNGLLAELVVEPIALCPSCNRSKASTRKSRLCAKCHKDWLKTQPKTMAQIIPQEVIAKFALAKTTEDWQNLARELAPTFTAILSGEVKATASQASLLKDVYNRAYGKPVATQTDKRIAAGLIILPTLDTGAKMTFICPQCGYDPTKSTEQYSKVLKVQTPETSTPVSSVE